MIHAYTIYPNITQVNSKSTLVYSLNSNKLAYEETKTKNLQST